MKTLRHLFWITLTALIATACTVAQEKSPEPKITAKSSVVSSFFSAKRYPSGQKFAWMPGAERYFEDPRINDPTLKPMLENAIQQSLIQSGYRFTPSVQQADFLVGYLVALESELDDQTIANLYGNTPGLPLQSTQNYEKGTLVIDIVDGVTRQSVWRGTLQAAVSFNVEHDVRHKRVTAAVETVLGGFLKANRD